MAANPNPGLSNRNTLYIARSGGGKSQALKQNSEIPAGGALVLLYDPNEDHAAYRYNNKKLFGRAAVAAVRSGKGCRVSYVGGFGEDDHEWFCQLVFALLDGRRLTYVIDEELGSAGVRSGRAAKHHARLMNQGRKFGLVYHGVVQFPTELPKTVYRNCEVKYVGPLDVDTAARISREVGVPTAKISSQIPLQFWVNDPAQGFEPRQISLIYKK